MNEKPQLKLKLLGIQTLLTRILLDNDPPTYEDIENVLKKLNEAITYCENRNRF